MAGFPLQGRRVLARVMAFPNRMICSNDGCRHFVALCLCVGFVDNVMFPILVPDARFVVKISGYFCTFYTSDFY